MTADTVVDHELLHNYAFAALFSLSPYQMLQEPHDQDTFFLTHPDNSFCRNHHIGMSSHSYLHLSAALRSAVLNAGSFSSSPYKQRLPI